MAKILEIIALLCCAVYFGSTVYVTFVEHPARLACLPFSEPERKLVADPKNGSGGKLLI
jgi:hypothetical protein